MSSTKTEQTQFEYAGWVPTVAGRLSFRHIGESEHPTQSIYANVTTGSARLILGYQRRPLSDSLFQAVTDAITRSSGDFWFALQAASTEQPERTDTIKGVVYVFKSRADWCTKAEKSVRPAIYRLNDLRLSTEPDRDAQIGTHFERSAGILRNSADISANFELTRDGVLRLTSPKFLDPDLEYASLNFAQSQSQDFSAWVANQIYFYLRDIIHRHQHHDMSEDTILILRRADKADVEWRRDIIFSLYFRIIRAKRAVDFPYSVRALGILAYCSSFKRVSAPVFKAAKFSIPAFNDAALRASIRASIEEHLMRRQAEESRAFSRATASINARMLVLTGVLIILAALALFAPEAAKEVELAQFSKSLAHFIVPLLQMSGLIILFVFVATSRRVLSWKDVLEISNVRRRSMTIVYLMVALAIMAGIVWEARTPIGALISLVLGHN